MQLVLSHTAFTDATVPMDPGRCSRSALKGQGRQKLLLTPLSLLFHIPAPRRAAPGRTARSHAAGLCSNEKRALPVSGAPLPQICISALMLGTEYSLLPPLSSRFSLFGNYQKFTRSPSSVPVHPDPPRGQNLDFAAPFPRRNRRLSNCIPLLVANPPLFCYPDGCQRPFAISCHWRSHKWNFNSGSMSCAKRRG